jgi:hypothetical protein
VLALHLTFMLQIQTPEAIEQAARIPSKIVDFIEALGGNGASDSVATVKKRQTLMFNCL